ncbi:MAG: 30S ribosomal protein S17 [Candidatus Moranbacteria bacterium GW2011_GWC2_37_8]|nr:MAG: 30S ribosomal protein S17 [Candidatus Moranbacteria bacterium GW2011_GWC2_37_8]KKQ62779.1 MAG: 30S 30S ribosomal protein S17, small subunit ribosomal protein S17 [Parcubacteria group bacterium GW2011_GWC1_38_22]KKQ81271.1 MAG: 30S ribosomal protein S17 [Candidatus Moranbacteria bacterium GW2011_GWD2_38_7]
MTNTTKKLSKKKGVVVSDAMNKTIVVAVQTLKTHPKYLKKYRSTKNYKVHDEENKFKKGETVEFVQCKPLSKDKSHTVIA